MWTVYDHPRDFPKSFVARKFSVTAAGAAATSDVIISPDLTALRELMAVKGLTCLTRHPSDDPVIVETWL